MPSAAAWSSAIRDELADGLARLVARQGQQLLDQVNGALDRRPEIRARLVPRRLVGRAVEQLQLAGAGGQGRTQLVGRIGDESALRLERRVQAGQQPVQLIHQRRNLLRQPGRGDRRQAVDVAPLDLAGNAPQRPQAVADHADDRRHRGAATAAAAESRPAAQRRAQGLAHPHRLGDLNHTLQSLQARRCAMAGRRRAHRRSRARSR